MISQWETLMKINFWRKKAALFFWKLLAISMSDKRKQQHFAIQTRMRLSIKDREVPNDLIAWRSV